MHVTVGLVFDCLRKDKHSANNSNIARIYPNQQFYSSSRDVCMACIYYISVFVKPDYGDLYYSITITVSLAYEYSERQNFLRLFD